MIEPRCFDYQTFIALQSAALCNYVEPLLAQCNTILAPEVLLQLYSGMDQFDEFHRVYALLLGMQNAPRQFAPLLPTYLADANASVSSTSYNLLASLSLELITDDVLKSVRNVLASGKLPKFARDVYDILISRLRSGENVEMQ